MNRYKDYDLLNANIMNDISNRLANLYNKLKKNNISNLNEYVKIEFKEYEPLYLEDVDYIENTIKNMGEAYQKPSGWQDSKDWIVNEEIVNRNFDNKDINRWNNNIELLENIIN